MKSYVTLQSPVVVICTTHFNSFPKQHNQLTFLMESRCVFFADEPFLQSEKKMKSSSDACDCGSKKCTRDNGGTYGGVWLSLRLVGVSSLESGGRCVRQESIFSRSEDVFTLNKYFIIYFVVSVRFAKIMLQ
jgi:hypothetical protein